MKFQLSFNKSSVVMIIAEAFMIDDERFMDTLINRGETFKHFINLDNLELKQAA